MTLASEEMQQSFKGIDTLVIDVTERAIQRPQDPAVQVEHYTVKKRHTHKNTVIAPLDFIILYVGYTFPGKNQDYGILTYYNI